MEREEGRGQLCVVHVGTHASQAPPQKSPVPSVKGIFKSHTGTCQNHQTFQQYFYTNWQTSVDVKLWDITVAAICSCTGERQIYCKVPLPSA